ncbi:MAG: DUF2723 domain-containing protein [Crocinitomicaceae bacterium]
MDYKKLNNYTGWGVFVIATLVYLLTLEPTVSLWDCGEYITTAYKLEVGHPPGAPLFMMLGRLFSFFVSTESAAFMINFMSALSSSASILFLFWTITMIAKKMYTNDGVFEFNKGQTFAILGSGVIGGLAYTFSDSFWFSAVEGEVYAMSSFFTAVVFWAALKWDEEVTLRKNDLLNHSKSDLRWMVFIMFMFGLSIGVHLLSLLVIPSFAFIIYFQKYLKVTPIGFVITGIAGLFTLVVIQDMIIPKTIEWASIFEISFVNSMGLPFYSGAMFFFLILIGLIVGGIIISRRKNWPMVNAGFLGLATLFIGYGCFAMIIIRSNANTPLNENAPKNLVALTSYLKREQYGDWPILRGPYWNSERDPSAGKDISPVYLRKWVVQSGDKDLKGFEEKESAEKWKAENETQYSSLDITEKYYMTFDGLNARPEYKEEHKTFFPRMWSPDARHVSRYKAWSNYKGNKKITVTYRGQQEYLPTMAENLRFFFHYQLNWMYFRYFFWNFAGRQNDEQGHGNVYDGNWQSGLNFIDKHRLGDQNLLPEYQKQNPSNNKFFFLPLILGLIGLAFHFLRDKKTAWVVSLLFIMTGVAIIVFLNQKPLEPRERDYAYAASFYAFAVWIGLSVMALYESYVRMTQKDFVTVAGTLAGVSVVSFLGGMALGLSMLYMSIVALVMLAVMFLMKGRVKQEMQAAIVALLIAIPAPTIMMIDGWDDHNRSNRYSARALAENYLNPLPDQAIIFTNGDNDTFPLWYLQEVEGKKTSVRVCNLSLLNTDWYTKQMAEKQNDSEALPIKFTLDQYLQQKGYLDAIVVKVGGDQMSDQEVSSNPQYTKQILMSYMSWSEEQYKEYVKMLFKNNRDSFDPVYKQAITQLSGYLTAKFYGGDTSKTAQIRALAISENINENSFFQLEKLIVSEILEKVGNKMADQEKESIVRLYGQVWQSMNYIPLDWFMNTFLKDEKNLASNANGSQQFFVSPGVNFLINVDKEAVLKNNYVHESFKDKIVDKMRFTINAPGGQLMKAGIIQLEIIANNNWERAIHFANSGGSDSYVGLDNYLILEGLSYKLSPVRVERVRNPYVRGGVNKEVMYENLMNVWTFGNLEKPGVLVDYYNRRHINNYRLQYWILGEVLADEYTKAKATGDQAKMTENKEKVVALMKRCLEMMPLEKIAPESYMINMVGILYQVDENEKGAELGNQLMDFADQRLNYFTNLENEFFHGELMQYFFDSYGQIYQGLSFVQSFGLDENDAFAAKVYDLREKYNGNVKSKLASLQSSKEIQLETNTLKRFFDLLGAEDQMMNPQPVPQPINGGGQPVPGNGQ